MHPSVDFLVRTAIIYYFDPLMSSVPNYKVEKQILFGILGRHSSDLSHCDITLANFTNVRTHAFTSHAHTNA